MTVVNIADRLPHRAEYVTCMNCAHDWIAAYPASCTGPLECSACGKMTGEPVRYDDPAWYTRYMSGPNQERRTLVLLNAKRMGMGASQ